MRRTVSSLLAVVGLAIVAAAPVQSRAADLTTLYSFCLLPNCADGSRPDGSLIADADGNLFGTTFYGGANLVPTAFGANGAGTVFEIAKTASGYARTPTILVSFCALPNCIDGQNPNGDLIADARGNLFGMTENGGAHGGGGTVFEIVKTAHGYSSTPAVLYSFCALANCADGETPSGLIIDAQGNLFGTTENGGAHGGGGTVFEIVKTAHGYASTPVVLYSFCALANCADGLSPNGSLITDANGNLFGMTTGGGANGGGGTVFEIAKKSHEGQGHDADRRNLHLAGLAGYDSTPATLVSFSFCGVLANCADGTAPSGGLIADADGNLFGTTINGGAGNDGGTVFEIVKTASGYARTPTTLVSFCALAHCADGFGPSGGLIADDNGNLFGTTRNGGGGNGLGTMFEIVKTASGYASTPTTPVSFCSLVNCTDGAQPNGGLIADANGNLFGTTFGVPEAACGGCGDIGGGTVFEITGSSFIVRHKFDGTPGRPSCFGQSVSALVQQYGGFMGAADALDYPSVPALQEAISAFCEPEEAADHRNQEHR